MSRANSNMTFEKWEACGNDFILTEQEVTPAQARSLCDRHFGVGADGVLSILKSDSADAKMIVTNADGSLAEMCGNGIRCVGQYVSSRLLRPDLTISTGAGLKSVRILSPNDRISIAMGSARLNWNRELTFTTGPQGHPRSYPNASSVDMGNPHCVLLLDDEKETRFGAVERFGRRIEALTDTFPEGTNVEFVTLAGEDHLRVKVWERGCGRTLACGTGACASAYAAHAQGLVGEVVTVTLDGGQVEIRLHDGVELIGPARKVFAGEIDLPRSV